MRVLRCLTAIVACLLVTCSAGAQGIQLAGKWASRLGVMRIHQDGKKVSGKLIWVSKTCPFKKGDQVLKGVLLEDSLAGQFRYCLTGKECSGSDWAPVVMLVARGGRVLSGAGHFGARKDACGIGGKGRGDGIVVRKVRRKPKPKQPKPEVKPDPGKMRDEDGQLLEEEIKPLNPEEFEKNAGSWREKMEEGQGWMQRGFFERARRMFKQAADLNPTRPEAFNGIGVTYYARGDYEEALSWYKLSLEVDPNFGDGYYNMACIYALMKKKSLAFRYLHIAVLNGYLEHQALVSDPDLNNLRDDDRYQGILRKMKAR
jgi:hypothetical protein